MSTPDEPLISVLMPAYNHERYVETSVRSVLDQDWANLELIVVDDGSSDATWDRLQELKAECERRLVRVEMACQENQGTCRTMNRLRALAGGRYVAILASDDAFAPGALRRMASVMASDASVGCVVGGNELMDGEGRPCYWDADRGVVAEREKAVYETFNAFITARTGVAIPGPLFGDYATLLGGNHVPNGALIRASALEAVPPFSPEAPLEDWWLHLQLAKLVRYAAVSETTFRYRWHATNTVRKTEVMHRNFWRTVQWEERRLQALGDKERLASFAAAFWRRTRRFGTGPFALDRLDTSCERRKVIRLFGHDFVLSRRPRNVV